MESLPECLDCIQNAAERTLKVLQLPPDENERVMMKILEYLNNADLSFTPMEISFGMFEIIRRETGVDDPLKFLKRESNHHALELVPRANELINGSINPLYTAIKIAIAGNIIDFGVRSEYNLSETLDEVLRKKPFIDDYESLLKKLSKAKTLTFLADNAGEVVFDKLLLERLTNLYSFEKILLILKKYPFGNDIVPEDVSDLGFEEILGLEIIALDNIPTKNYTEQIKTYISQADITIAKGQGNFELLYNKKLGLFFLFIVKCDVVKDILNSQKGDILISFQ
ncbi:DUF89 family protein [Candidatus Heimdallarchaeota archaeon]|nr:MAG: DUF89 family protein [Candidatus Heimdallarchaeota archaeon]